MRGQHHDSQARRDRESAIASSRARQGRSMEEEAHELLRGAPVGDVLPGQDMAQAIRRHIEPLGGMNLTLLDGVRFGVRLR
ncbi:MAG TPA: hypothetical protein VER03_00105 [Bryobacteraceae bacterium]|nr:hypothetical protein [Bryobacteraceae bacterium]